jgi:hypothetical protein
MGLPSVFRFRATRALAAILVTGAAAVSLAEGPPGSASAPSRRPNTWGNLDPVAYRVPSSDFTTTNSNIGWAYDNIDIPTTRRYSTVRLGEFMGPTHIPTGALIELFELDYCDTAPQLAVLAVLEVYKKDGSFVQSLGQLQSNDDGCALVFLKPAVIYQVANDAEDLVVRVRTEAGDATTSFSGVTLYYRLQTSPAPAVGTFSDVPTTYLFFRAIEAMAESGITVGCGTGIYCPDQNVTRGEMAAFFARALGLHFPDVPPGP